METEIQKMPKKEFYPLILTLSAVTMAILVFFIIRGPNLNLWVPVGIYAFLDLVLLFALIYGFKIKNRPLQIFSILFSIFSFVVMTGLIFLLMLGIGISEA